MKTIRMRESKFGRALVIETVARSGGCVHSQPAMHPPPRTALLHNRLRFGSFFGVCDASCGWLDACLGTACIRYILGFRVDPQDKLEGVFQELNSLHQVYSVNPIFGDFNQPTKTAPRPPTRVETSR